MTRLLASRVTQLVVVAASLLAAASMGGGFLAGVVLVPMLVVLGARAGRVVAVVDGLLAAVLSAELGWAAAYVAVGEQQPLIWLVPAVGALLAGVVLVRVRLASAPAASPSRW